MDSATQTAPSAIKTQSETMPPPPEFKAATPTAKSSPPTSSQLTCGYLIALVQEAGRLQAFGEYSSPPNGGETRNKTTHDGKSNTLRLIPNAQAQRAGKTTNRLEASTHSPLALHLANLTRLKLLLAAPTEPNTAADLSSQRVFMRSRWQIGLMDDQISSWS